MFIDANEGAVQDFVVKNKGAIIALVALLVMGILGYGIFKMQSEKSHAIYNQKIYQFEKKILIEYAKEQTALEAGKTSVTLDSVLSALINLKKEVGNYSGLFPIYLKLGDALAAKNELAKAKEQFESALSVAKNEYARELAMTRMAIVLEDLGDFKGSIETLKELSTRKAAVFPGKVFLDLGRLYLKTNDRDNAQKSFKYVIEKENTESEFVKLAELYLAQMK